MNIAIGAAGISPLRSHVGARDPQGFPLQATIASLADEVAAAAGLVSGKLNRIPVVIVRGLEYERRWKGPRTYSRTPRGLLPVTLDSGHPNAQHVRNLCLASAAGSTSPYIRKGATKMPSACVLPFPAKSPFSSCSMANEERVKWSRIRLRTEYESGGKPYTDQRRNQKHEPTNTRA